MLLMLIFSPLKLRHSVRKRGWPIQQSRRPHTYSYKLQIGQYISAEQIHSFLSASFAADSHFAHARVAVVTMNVDA